jgi:predicted oxidoreductase
MKVSRVTMTVDELEVSQFIAGLWRQNSWGFTDSELQAYIESLLESGVTTMDHAYVYRSEPQFGRVLTSAPHLRDGMEIVSKFGIRPAGFGGLGAQKTNHYDSSPEHLTDSVEATLSDLHTDYLDVLLVHRPDYLMDAGALASAFSKLKEQGKVRFFGVSNFSASQFELLQAACDFPLVTNQIEFSPLCPDPLESGVLDQCQRHHMNPMLWSCLGGGRLFTGSDEQSVRVRDALCLVADEVGAQSLDQVVYAWVLSLPCNPLPIIGSGKIERVKSAIAAENLKLDREQWYSIWEASTGYSVP